MGANGSYVETWEVGNLDECDGKGDLEEDDDAKGREGDGDGDSDGEDDDAEEDAEWGVTDGNGEVTDEGSDEDNISLIFPIFTLLPLPSTVVPPFSSSTGLEPFLNVSTNSSYIPTSAPNAESSEERTRMKRIRRCM